jgi:hypothetical protein
MIILYAYIYLFHSDPILIVSESNTSVHLTAIDTNDSQSKRSHSSLLVEEEAIHTTPSSVSSSSTSSSVIINVMILF